MLYRQLLAATALALAAPLTAQSVDPGEPVAVASHVEQGIDFVYVDPQLSALAQQPRAQQPRNWMLRTVAFDWGETATRSAPNRLYQQLRGAAEQYRMTWGALPQFNIPAGATIGEGSDEELVSMLRERLGLAPGVEFDGALEETLREYQRVHGLKTTGRADQATIRSLNRGAPYYLQRIAVNAERARRLPETGQFGRYVLVDSGSAEVHLIERDRIADSMRAIVGAPDTKTPMMAVVMQSAKVNPYWNVPPNLIQSFTAPKVLKQGVSYLANYNYEVLPDWEPESEPIDPRSIDWEEVAAGNSNIRVRQLPGPWNSMGEVKFETPNRYGIYLHDTPKKELFREANRWVSNGCVRLEDADRFASWVFGDLPSGQRPEQRVQLPEPVPVYMTYLTVAATADGVQFRPDPYGFDERAIGRAFGGERLASLDY